LIEKKGASESDLESWAAFERAVDTVVKGGPQHRGRRKKAIFSWDAVTSVETLSLSLPPRPPYELEPHQLRALQRA
jgi:hypothetical protein